MLHPCKGVKGPTVPVKAFRILTPEQFERLYAALPTDDARLLVETAIDSGLRWGELTELRVKDLDPASRILTVSRAVVQLDPKFHPTGGRFHVKGYPKNRLARRLKLSPGIASQLADSVKQRRLGPEGLLFCMTVTPAPVLRLVADDDPGLTEPTAEGRQYVHGTLSAYTAGRCRCAACRRAIADYRAGRRAQGKDDPRTPREVDTDGHIPRDWFARRIWKPAVKAAGLEPVRLHDLRHAHASWLLAGGADLQVVKERLGHASLATPERYLHTLPGADETALDALAVVRVGARQRVSS
jgi:integrase